MVSKGALKLETRHFLKLILMWRKRLCLCQRVALQSQKTPPEIAYRVRTASTDASRYEFSNVALVEYLRLIEGFGIDMYIQEQYKKYWN
jgi:hypothetical protein